MTTADAVGFMLASVTTGRSRGLRFKGDPEPVGFGNREVKLLEADYLSGGVFHENHFVACLLTDVFPSSIAEPDGERPPLPIVEHAYFGHIRTPSLIASVG